MDSRRPISLVLAALLAAACGGLAACGSDSGNGKQLSAATASELRSALDRVEQDVNAGDCEAATTQARALVERTGGLSGAVDADLRQALVDSADRLQVLVAERCATSATGPSRPTESGTSGETGPSGTTGKQEKQKKPEKKKAKGPKVPKGPTGRGQTGTTGGDGVDNQNSGGAAP